MLEKHIVNDNSNNDVIMYSTIKLRQGTHVTFPPRFPSRFQTFAGPIWPVINKKNVAENVAESLHVVPASTGPKYDLEPL